MDITEDDIAKAVSRALSSRQIAIYGPRGDVKGAIKPADCSRIEREVLASLRVVHQRAHAIATVTALPTTQSAGIDGQVAA